MSTVKLNLEGMYGHLTTDCAASSYGQPVLVIEDDGRAPAHLVGRVYGPGDRLTYDTDSRFRGEWSETAAELVARGYVLSGDRALCGRFVAWPRPGDEPPPYSDHDRRLDALLARLYELPDHYRGADAEVRRALAQLRMAATGIAELRGVDLRRRSEEVKALLAETRAAAAIERST